MEIRPAEDADAEAAAAILREADDARVLSAAGWLHQRRTSPADARMLQLAAVDGEQVVAVGGAGLDLWTSAAGNAWPWRSRQVSVRRRARRAAAARGVTRVTTSNADENTAMRAVNRKLGFAPIGEHVIVGRDLV